MPEIFLAVARNARSRRGRKSTVRHCGKVIEAQPTLGQISPSEAARVPADRPRDLMIVAAAARRYVVLRFGMHLRREAHASQNGQVPQNVWCTT
jgi:hypothetical protein